MAHPDKQTSSGGAWARSVILLASRRVKEEVDRNSSSYRLLDQQGGQSLLVGFVLSGGEWHPPPPSNWRQPAYTMTLRERRIPGGPVKAEKALLTNEAGARGAEPVPLLGEPNMGLDRASAGMSPAPKAGGGAHGGATSMYAASQPAGAPSGGRGRSSEGQPPLFLVRDAAAIAQVASAATRMYSPSNVVLMLHCDGAAVWTDEQIVREVRQHGGVCKSTSRRMLCTAMFAAHILRAMSCACCHACCELFVRRAMHMTSCARDKVWVPLTSSHALASGCLRVVGGSASDGGACVACA